MLRDVVVDDDGDDVDVDVVDDDVDDDVDDVDAERRSWTLSPNDQS